MEAKYDEKTGILSLKIRLDNPRPSATGKMDMRYTSGGFQDLGVQVDGRPLRANISIGHKS